MTKNFIAATVVLIMAAVLISGCKTEEPSDQTPEYIYVAETVPLPDDIGNIRNLAYWDNKVYFIANNAVYNEDYTYAFSSGIYSMNTDGTGFGKLPNYNSPTTAIPGALGGVNIDAMHIDEGGNIWLAERWQFSEYVDLPSTFTNNDYPSNYEKLLESGNVVRKLDSSGAEIAVFDMADLFGDDLKFSVGSLGTDDLGNTYISANNWATGSTSIYVHDSNGNAEFQLDDVGSVAKLIKTPGGSVGFIDLSLSETSEGDHILQEIDFNARALSVAPTIPSVGEQIHQGEGDYDFLISDYDSDVLYGYKSGVGEAVKLLSWEESGVFNNGIDNIIMLPDERIICINYTPNYDSRELLVLTKTPYSEVEHREKTNLTLATFNADSMRGYVAEFNAANPNYRIEVVDYRAFGSGDDMSAAITRFTTEISSGNVPDILDLHSLPYERYASIGLLENLYPFIDADPAFTVGRSDFVEGTFRAAEVKGGLYQIFPQFSVNTIVGHPSVVGSDTGWDMDEFMAVLDAYPDADMPLGNLFNKMSFLQKAVTYSINEYIDWGAGTAHFDTDSFVQLLELANMFPDDLSYNQGSSDTSLATPAPGGGGGFSDESSEEELIAAGRQIMSETRLSNLWQFQSHKAAFGGELVFKGFPAANGSGNALSIISGFAMLAESENKEGAWEFLRMFLDKDWQLANIYSGFPTNRAAFDENFEGAMRESEAEYNKPQNERTFPHFNFTPITQSDYEQILALVASCSSTAWAVDDGIWNIVSEGAADYFSGQKSAREAAEIIQSRAAILVSEQSRG